MVLGGKVLTYECGDCLICLMPLPQHWKDAIIVLLYKGKCNRMNDKTIRDFVH